MEAGQNTITNCHPPRGGDLEAIEPLSDSDVEVRLRGLQYLGEAGIRAKYASPHIVALLKDPSPLVRSRAAWALSETGVDVRECCAALVQILSDPRPYARASALAHLAEYHGDNAITRASVFPAMSLLLDNDGDVAFYAGLLLKHLGRGLLARVAAETGKTMHEWERELKSGDRPQRIQAALILSDSNVPCSLGLMREIKWSENGLNRAWAVILWKHGLGQYDALLPLLRDSDPGVRRLALAISGEVSCMQATPFIQMALRDQDSGIRMTAAAALGMLHLADKVALAKLEDALDDVDGRVRAAVCRSLGEIGPPAQTAVTRLLHCVRDPDEVVSHQAVIAIVKLRPSSSEVLLALVEEFSKGRERVYPVLKHAIIFLLPFARDLLLVRAKVRELSHHLSDGVRSASREILSCIDRTGNWETVCFSNMFNFF